jgi:hypothetical protein
MFATQPPLEQLSSTAVDPLPSALHDPRAAARQLRFIRLLQLAFSAELGAALAYCGHAAAVTDPAQRRRITEIRLEELDHRARLGRMLGHLESSPNALLELQYRCIGTAIAAFCHVGGWFLPMYGAGWLERQNIAEYEAAARLAALCDEPVFADELLLLAEVEWEHERYFRLQAASHRLARLLRIWRAPAPRETIRRDYARFLHDRVRVDVGLALLTLA